MQLYELFSLQGTVWFKKGSYYYTLEQVQMIMREVIRVQPQNAESIFQEFRQCSKPPNYRQ
ncbi:MAG: hypothetical protein ABI347_11795 [Nitrososphaera sp.]